SNKEIKYEAFRKKAMKIPLTELQDCNFIHYSLQVYLYKNIFEKNTGFITEDPFIIHFDVTKDNYTLIEPKKLDKEVLKILEMRRRKNMKSLPILLIGKSGSGKSASLRNFKKEEVGIINVIGKELPFKNDLKYACTDNYQEVLKAVTLANKKTIVIDDASYLITNQFMRNHSKGGGGNAVFAVYNELADNFWNLISEIKKIDGGKTVYFVMHEETDEFGNTKPKTIGKLLDDKVCIEGMFTVALRSMIKDGKYVIRTKTDGSDIVKTPMKMFEETEVDNDLKEIDKKIREYYNLDEEEKVEVVEEKTEGKETEKEIKKEEEIK
ncbi:MAG: AAA family ATPase, partial [Bacilli bacterium]